MRADDARIGLPADRRIAPPLHGPVVLIEARQHVTEMADSAVRLCEPILAPRLLSASLGR